MFKKLIVMLLAFVAASVFAAVDVNKATQAELETIKGIGPAISTKILDERKKGDFKDWEDMVTRVKGVGEGNAAKFSTEGMTVNGSAYKGAPAAPAKADKKAPKEDKKSAASATPAATTPATPAPAASATMTAADKKAAAKQAKEDKKAEKAAKAAAAKASEPAKK